MQALAGSLQPERVHCPLRHEAFTLESTGASTLA
jgi:hypothetical protein